MNDATKGAEHKQTNKQKKKKNETKQSAYVSEMDGARLTDNDD